MIISMITGTHLTATNKRHIGELLSQGITQGGTKRLHYKFTSIEGDVAAVTISHIDINDYGKKFVRTQDATVRFAA